MNLLFDIETNGIDFKDGNWIDRVHIVHCLVVMDLDSGNVSRYYDTDGLRELGTESIRSGLKYLKDNM